MNDQTIIALFFQRAEQAIEELIRKYGRAVRRVIGRILRDERDAEECANDTYLAVWNTVPPQKPDPLAAYVCRIGRNLAVKRYHANTAARRNPVYETALDELETVLPARETVDSELSARELTAAIDAFLDNCPETDRYFFVRRYWFADSVSELAASTGHSAHYVSVRLSRLRERLRIWLEEEGAAI